MSLNNDSKILHPSLVLILVLLVATAVSAGPRDHEDGFFLRLSAGGGTANSSADDGTDEMELSGTSGDVNFAIGGMISPNLALHATVFGWSISDPTVKMNGTEVGDLNADVTATGIGAGLTYYFMPANLYLSGSVGSGKMEVDAGGGLDGETDRGLLLDLTIGKEWWVGDKWGLGVAGGLQYHSFNDPDIDEKWSGTSFAIRFTATMN